MEPPSDTIEGPSDIDAGKSYNKMYDEVFAQKPLVTNRAIKKPSKEAQAEEPGAAKVGLMGAMEA